MHSFLQHAVSHILENHAGQLDRVALVLPGRRPMVYLRKMLGERLSATAWMPTSLTIQDAMERLSGFRKMDALELWTISYERYRESVKDPDDLDRFLNWAPTVLADFSEIDNYGLHGEDVFRNLASFTEIDQWSFHLDPLSEGQQRFQVQWDEMGAFYQNLRNHLLAEKAGYTGLVNRMAAEHWESAPGSPDWPFDHVYFLGFNALSASEEAVLFGMQRAGKATLLWDADHRFVDDPVHESGMFLRRYAKRHGNLELGSGWKLNAENVRLHTTSSRVAQPKVLANILQNIPREELTKTAVVLGDESLLVPVLESLPQLGDPENPLPYNLTLGYPLRYTPVYDLIHLLHTAQTRMRSGGVWFQDVRSLLRHAALAPVLRNSGGQASTVLEQMRKHNHAFASVDQLRQAWKEVPVLQAILEVLNSPYTKPEETCERLLDLLQALRHANQHTPWLLEMVFRTHRSVQTLQTWCLRLDHPLGETAFWNLWRRLAGSEQLDFRGEPLEGLQIMGMLETRTLGFERLLVIGANEGHMPRIPSSDSFIPVDLKVHLGLPVRHERDAIYAYYFFRLLQDAQQVDFIYSEQTDDFGSSERSRYLGQLEELLEAEPSFQTQTWQNPLPPAEGDMGWEFSNEPQAIEKLKKLLDRGLSPSALNTYFRCPLDFFFKYVSGFREPDEVAEAVDHALFGTLVHGVLEYLYLDGKPSDPERQEPLGTKLTPAFLDDCIAQTPALFDQIRTTRKGVPFDPKKPVYLPELETGLNRLTLETAEAYVLRFLRAEKAASKEHVAEILYLEKPLEATCQLPEESPYPSIKLRGTLDRIDRVNGQIRIIDYKSGSVDGRKLMPGEDAEKLMHPDYDKARQLLVYHLLAADQPWAKKGALVCGMISLKQVSNWVQYGNPEFDQPEPFTNAQLTAFRQALAATASEMLDPERTWKHRAQLMSFCAFCNP